MIKNKIHELKDSIGAFFEKVKGTLLIVFSFFKISVIKLNYDHLLGHISDLFKNQEHGSSKYQKFTQYIVF